MFGFVIGGSGKLYLQVYLRITDASPAVPAWKPITSAAEYRLFGRFSNGRVLLNNPTLPHPLSGRPSDSVSERTINELQGWRLQMKRLDLQRNVFVEAR